MLWKEEYKLGVLLLDSQHKQLIDAIDALINTIVKANEHQAKKDCLDFIHFLKQYFDKNFILEEEYLSSIHYVGLEDHKKQHKIFVHTIHRYEKDFQHREISPTLIKDFIGTLLTWVVYHIQGYDKQVITGEPISLCCDNMETEDSLISAMTSTFHTLFFIDIKKKSETLYSTHLHGNVFASVEFHGSKEAYVVFSFDTEMVYRLICLMTSLENMQNGDDLIISSVKILVNTIATHVAIMLTNNIKSCSVSSPIVTLNRFDTTVTNYLNGKILSFTSSYGDFEILLKEQFT